MRQLYLYKYLYNLLLTRMYIGIMLVELLINEVIPMSQKIVRLSDKTSEMLDKLSEKRKAENAFVRTKQDLVAEAVINLYKKEIK